LADAFNNTGISDDTDAGAADLDGAGGSYSAQALAGSGLGPGAVLTRDGLTFCWPEVPSGQPDNVIAAGVPAKVIGEAGCPEPSRYMDHLFIEG